MGKGMNFSIKNNKILQFTLILVFNILFFSLAAHFLPTSFEENDDVAMCLIASGAYTGVPEPRLVFIHYFYGLVLTLFYKAFRGVEWYTLSFCVIHVISLSVIVHSFLKLNKSKLIKGVSLILLYTLELTIIQSLQFTTTAAIAAFAGIMLIFEKKRFYGYCGIALFFIATFIRFDSAMMVMLLMLPFIMYKVFPDAKKNIKLIIPVAVCILGAFLLQVFDRQAYNVEKWSYYRDYNEARGFILGNPNRVLVMNDLPDDISQGDYYLFLYHFIDGKFFNFEKIKEIRSLISDISFSEKLKNILPFINNYKWILSLIIISAGLFFFFANKRIMKLFVLFYLFYLFVIILYITLDGRINQRVFMSIFFPVLYFLYYAVPIFSKKCLNITYSFILILLSLLFIDNIYKIGRYRNYVRETAIKEQRALLQSVRNRNITLLGFAADLQIENICGPFEISKYFKGFSQVGGGWFTNIPYNNGNFDSFLSLVEKDIYLFIAFQNQFAIPLIQDSLRNNYDCKTEVALAARTDNYLLIKFVGE
jgi:hypothetical protein